MNEVQGTEEAGKSTSLQWLTAFTILTLQLLAKPHLKLLVGDSWFCFRFGRYIVETLSLPRVNYDVVVGYGRPWFDAQWLAHVFLYQIFEWTSFAGLYVLVLSVNLFVFWMAIRQMQALGARPILASVTLLAVATIFAPFAVVRAELFGFVCFALHATLVVSDRAWVRWLTLPLVCLWANLHGSVYLSIIHVGLAVLMSSRGHSRRSILAVAVLTLLCIFATPYGFSTIINVTGTVGTNFHRDVNLEWMPVWKLANFETVTPIALSIVALACGYRRRCSFGWLHILCFLALSCYSNRYGRFLKISLLFFLFAMLQEPLSQRFRTTLHKASKPVFAVMICIALLLSVRAVNLFQVYNVDRFLVTERAQNRAAAIADSALVWTDMTLGDWVLWNWRSLRGRVSYDVRGELFRRDDYQEILHFTGPKSNADLDSVVERKQPECIFVDPGTVSPLTTAGLISRHDFTLVERRGGYMFLCTPVTR